MNRVSPVIHVIRRTTKRSKDKMTNAKSGKKMHGYLVGLGQREDRPNSKRCPRIIQ